MVYVQLIQPWEVTVFIFLDSILLMCTHIPCILCIFMFEKLINFIKFDQINLITILLFQIFLYPAHFPYLLEPVVFLTSYSTPLFFPLKLSFFSSENVSYQEIAQKLETDNFLPGRTKSRNTDCICTICSILQVTFFNVQWCF